VADFGRASTPRCSVPSKCSTCSPFFPNQMKLDTFFRITATILGPTPLLAANFVIIGIIIRRLGPQYSRLSPKWCMSLHLLFCFVLVSLINGPAGFDRYHHILHLCRFVLWKPTKSRADAGVNPLGCHIACGAGCRWWLCLRRSSCG
jgi:hypothetical protein